jgi:hypothetical protein
VDPAADAGEVDAVLGRLPGRSRARDGIERHVAQALRHDGGELGDEVGGGARQGRIAARLHPAGAEGRRLDLVGGQHQRRQVEAAFQHVAETRLAADRHALADEGGDVAVDRTLRCLELGGNGLGRQGPARAAQDLDDLEQAV